MNFKRIMATIAVIALVALYVATFVIALLDFPDKNRILGGFIMLDIFIPIMAWMFIQLHKYFGPKK